MEIGFNFTTTQKNESSILYFHRLLANMKKTPQYISLILLAICCCLNLNAQNSIMSFNIRYNTPDDNENWWEYRKGDIVSMISYYHPDIFGIQEGQYGQVSFLDKMLADYNYIGVGRDDGKEKGEFTAIFFDAKKFEVILENTYWLSETPDTVSVGWDASMVRITTYGVFRDKTTHDTLHVFNCHYDHIGKVAREKSSALILSFIKEKGLQEDKVIVMGDFNSEPHHQPIQVLKTELKDANENCKISAYGPTGTFNNFDTSKVPTARIDYIFTKNLEVESYRNIDDRRINNLYLSDHLPVLIIVNSPAANGIQ
jgi:endonuclease/exonuclease/phosphatase family metal-dependent hydrolase